MAHDDRTTSRPNTTASSATLSPAHLQVNEKNNEKSPESVPPVAPGHEESAPLGGKVEEAVDTSDEDWEHDPANARNWPLSKKWRTVSVVSPAAAFSCSELPFD